MGIARNSNSGRGRQVVIAHHARVLLCSCLILLAVSGASAQVLEPVQTVLDEGLNFGQDLAFSPDGKHAYVVAEDAVWAFSCDMDGTLAFVGVERDGVDGVDG